ncbi:uncharacterized protein PFL1_06286 [Pseudozyma flocculosa PF-1]|uniref:Related to CAP1 - F-actin capping protein alpha subunit n=2 Tax=Pseudozyma flocculosa TaxID=84751 RepID=A0A5C3F7F1_9BASI|nr:uncharacterized protein PFL1_06286 [Pseudozyma flocculosa PF-1]EPQ26078.1 hypothetical protein PFL1_06286 [Pseudozyma flocculosa PF-1]SPO40322.1 related to CAP1 - F-actin capping protein alpha subunit [Pseudozyma flocculosa]
MPSDRLSAAARLLVQAPPGQVSQVYHDLRGILLDPEAGADDGQTIDDAQIKHMALVALEEYNTSQLIPVAIDEAAKDHVIICQAAQIPSSTDTATKRYAHPRAKKSFAFDHMARTASDIQDLPVDEDAEPLRAALDAALQNYVADRYNSGVSSVFAVSNVPYKPAAPTAAASSDAQQQQHEEAAKVDAEDPAVPTAAAAANEDAETEGAEKKGDGSPNQEGDATAADDDGDNVKDDPVEAAAASEAVSSDSTSPTAAAAEEARDASEQQQPQEQEPETTPRQIKYTFHHVGNKYHLSNFWSGRWRASYTLDVEAATLTSSLQVQVHYFENGNVQLNASKPKTFHLDQSSLAGEGSESEHVKRVAEHVVKLVERHEDDYQSLLEETYEDLGEKAFKALRRQLPLTKNKIDWNQLMNYRLGAELARQ